MGATTSKGGGHPTDRLRVAVLGPPEVVHDGHRLTFALRKAQALLLYLAVEGGLHPRSRLAAFLWPDSESHTARTALRNALTLLHGLLADASPAGPSHLLSSRELVGLDPQAPLKLDLEVVQQAYNQAQRFPTPPAEPQRTSLVTTLQHALSLVRGPFLDGFELGEDAPFDEWVQRQQRQWQVRVQFLFDRLSSWHEGAGEWKPARVTLSRWLELEPLSEEASRRLMRLHLAMGDPTAALQVYTTFRARLQQELQVEPSAQTVALAARIRASAAARPANPPARPAPISPTSQPPGQLLAPLIGRASAFSQLVACFQQARAGLPQAVLLLGEAGIGKTRLATEFVAWAGAQGAQVLGGQAFELGGQLPYQPLVEALRPRLEAENAPEDLLSDLWLSELARLLPELRVRYPDLPAPTHDELTARLRLFEAVARLLEALARRAPLVLLLDDLQWMDEASLDLLRYLARDWKGHGRRVLLLLTGRSEGMGPRSPLAAQLADLARDLPLSQLPLQLLSHAQTRQLLEAIVGQREQDPARPATIGPGASPGQDAQAPLAALGDWLFAQTGGQPLYLLETLKLLQERQWLVPRLSADGVFRLELDVDIAVVQEQSRRELLPPSVHAMIQARLSELTPTARQMVMACAVLGEQATAKSLWQVAEEGTLFGGQRTQAGLEALIEALEEAVRSGILHEEEAGAGRPGSYHFAHELIREVVYLEMGKARRQILHQRALALLEAKEATAAELAYHARASGEAEAAYRYSVQAGDEALAVFAVDDAIRHYEQARALLREQKLLQTELAAWDVEHLYASLGRAYTFQNAWEKAQDAYEELVAYAQQRLRPTLGRRTLNRLAMLAVQQSKDKPQVQAFLQEARQMAQISSDQRALAKTAWKAEGIGDETLCSRFLAGPPIQQVVQHAPSEVSLVPNATRKPLHDALRGSKLCHFSWSL